MDHESGPPRPLHSGASPGFDRITDEPVTNNPSLGPVQEFAPTWSYGAAWVAGWRSWRVVDTGNTFLVLYAGREIRAVPYEREYGDWLRACSIAMRWVEAVDRLAGVVPDEVLAVRAAAIMAELEGRSIVQLVEP